MGANEELLVKLSGAMTIQSIRQAYEVLLDAFGDERSPVLDISEVDDADLTFVQLIQSARRTAAERGQVLSLATGAPDAVISVLERGGFIQAASDEESRFWRAQGEER